MELLVRRRSLNTIAWIFLWNEVGQAILFLTNE